MSGLWELVIRLIRFGSFRFSSMKKRKYPFQLRAVFLQSRNLSYVNLLNLIHKFLRPSPSAIYGKKSKNFACDVTVGTKKIQLCVTDTTSVGLFYGANFKWHMRGIKPCWTKYMPFFGTVTKRDFRKKIPKHRNICKWSKVMLLIFS